MSIPNYKVRKWTCAQPPFDTLFRPDVHPGESTASLYRRRTGLGPRPESIPRAFENHQRYRGWARSFLIPHDFLSVISVM